MGEYLKSVLNNIEASKSVILESVFSNVWSSHVANW